MSFILIAAIAGIFYALQGAFLAKYSRSIGGFKTSLYRNASFILTMSPVLIFAGIDGIYSIQPIILPMVLSGFFGALSIIFTFGAQKYLPISLGDIIRRTEPLFLFLGILVITKTLPTLIETLSIIFIVLGIVIIKIGPQNFSHLPQKSGKGIFMGIAGAIAASISVGIMGWAANNANPFAVGYFWEVSIGISMIVFYILKKAFFQKHHQTISFSEGKNVALAALPTVIASALFPLAMQMGGNFAITSIIAASLGIIATLFLGFFLYKESLHWKHFLGMGIILWGIIVIQV